MLKLSIILVYAYFNILEIFGHSNNDKKTITTPNPFANLLDKFHQNDYQLIYEWSELIHSDENCIEYYRRTFKYNRTTTVTNVSFLMKVDFGYKLESVAQVYRFASNEYRLYPIRFQFNLCEAIDKKVMGLDKLSTNGNLSCPLLKGKRYHYYNWIPESSRFPPLIPTGRYAVDLIYMYQSKECLVTRDYGSVVRPFV